MDFGRFLFTYGGWLLFVIVIEFSEFIERCFVKQNRIAPALFCKRLK